VTDWQLLQRWVQTGSEPAFAELVARYANLVYGCGLRQTGDCHAAEDISQAVFIILARRARFIGSTTPLGGWLFNVARFTATNYRRMNARRLRREQQAAAMISKRNATQPANAEISRLLDNAIAALSSKERDAVIMRFYENKTNQEVGSALGISEDAAAQRISRAVSHLGDWFRRKGSGLSQAGLIAMLPIEFSQSIPTQLIHKMTSVAIKPILDSTISSQLARHALRAVAWAKIKFLTGTLAALLLLSVGGAAYYRNLSVPAQVPQLSPSISGTVTRSFSHPGTAVLKAAISADGQRALTGGGLPFNATRAVHTEIRLWDLNSGKELQQFQGHTGRLTGLTFLPGDDRAISAADDGTARLWNLNTGLQMKLYDAQLPITGMALSPNGKTILTGARVLTTLQYEPIANQTTPTLRLWDVQSGQDFQMFRQFTHGVSHVAYAPNGHQIAASLDPEPQQILLWNLDQSEPMRLHLPRTLVTSLIFSPEGTLVAGFQDGTIRKWDSLTGKELDHWKVEDGEVFALAFSTHGQFLISAGGTVHVTSPGVSEWTDCLLHVCDARTGTRLAAWPGHETGVYSLEFNATGEELLSAGGQRVCLRTVKGN
jgi:RNA polymerase sigma factor (sigma-70 family)